jgi:hypothetical protein
MTARSAFLGVIFFARLLFSKRARKDIQELCSSLDAAHNEIAAHLARMRREREDGSMARPRLTIAKNDIA